MSNVLDIRMRNNGFEEIPAGNVRLASLLWSQFYCNYQQYYINIYIYIYNHSDWTAQDSVGGNQVVNFVAFQPDFSGYVTSIADYVSISATWHWPVLSAD